MLHTVMVAPVTSTRHGIATEVPIGVDQGMKGPCAINLDHAHTTLSSDSWRPKSTNRSTIDRELSSQCSSAAAMG